MKNEATANSTGCSLQRKQLEGTKSRQQHATMVSRTTQERDRIGRASTGRDSVPKVSLRHPKGGESHLSVRPLTPWRTTLQTNHIMSDQISCHTRRLNETRNVLFLHRTKRDRELERQPHQKARTTIRQLVQEEKSSLLKSSQQAVLLFRVHRRGKQQEQQHEPDNRPWARGATVYILHVGE